MKPKSTRFPLKVRDILIGNFQEPVHNLDQEGRGVCVYVREGLNYKILETKYFNQAIRIEVESPTCKPTIIGVMYRSPNCSQEENRNLNKEVKEALYDTDTNTLILGDFNYPEIDWNRQVSRGGPHHRATEFLDCVQDSLAHQRVVKPTHFRPGQQATLIDLALTNYPDVVSQIQHAPSLGKSHHETLIVNVEQISLKGPEPPRPLKYLYQRANFEDMRGKLKEESLSEKILNLNCEQAWQEVKGTIHKLRDKHVPTSRVVIGKGVVKKPLWMNDTALTKVKKKHSAYRRYLTTREGADYLTYVQMRNEAHNEVRRTKRIFEKRIAGETKRNPKAFWGYYKDRTQRRQQVPTLIDDAGGTSETPADKAECLNKFFSSVFTREDTSNIPTIQRKPVMTPMEHCVITEEEVRKKLTNINPAKSQGPDEIHPKVLFELKEDLVEPLTILFNKSLREMTVPEDWKEAHVSPIYKKGDRNIAGNYRPISLTSVVCKLLESIIRDHMMKHLINNDMLNQHQHGFVPKKGCNTNLLESMECWLNLLEEGQCVDIFYLDYAKAFDKVPHMRLLTKVESFGFAPEIVGWITSFLNKRNQSVRVENVLSEPKEVVSGVPQGSVLGPILFVLYVNDQPDVVENNLEMFADDAKSYGAGGSREMDLKCQNDLNALERWTEEWQMGYNLTKCKHMRLGNTPVEHQYYLTNPDGSKFYIDTIKEERDLGVIVDKNLKFQKHIDNIVKIANSVLGTIKRTFTNINRKTFTLLYKALVRSHLEYGQEVWHPRLKGQIGQLEKVQRRATKLVKNIRHLPYRERLKRLDLPSLKHRRLRGDMITLYKITHGLMNTNIQVPYSANHHLRGHCLKLAYSTSTSPARRHFITARSTGDWNSLPESVVMAPSLLSFKNRLDKHWDQTRDIYSC